MLPLSLSLDDGVFGPEATKAMGDAFDRAKRQIPATSNQEAVALRILEAARHGERDVDRLSAAACSACSQPS
jgi:hypothetical protein